MPARSLQWRDVLAPLLSASGLIFLFQDVLLSDTLRPRLFGPTLAEKLSHLPGAAAPVAAILLVAALWGLGWYVRSRREGGCTKSEVAARLWPLALLNGLLIGDPTGLLTYAHLYLGLGCLGLTVWNLLASPVSSPEDRWEGPARLRDIPWVVFVAVGIYFALFMSMAVLQYHSLNLQPIDFFAVEQRLWNALHGDFLRSDHTAFSLLAEHVQLIDLLLLPVYALCPRPETLFALHILAAATSCLPVWVFAAESLCSRRVATAFAIAFLLHPGLHYGHLEISGAALNSFMYGVPFLLWGLVFLYRGQFFRWSVCSIFALLVREEMGLLIFMQGLYIAMGRGERRKGDRALGLGAAAAGMLWCVVCLWIVIPSFRGGTPHSFQHYQHLGGSGTEIVLNALRSPWLVLRHVLTGQNLEFLITLFLPYGWLGFLDPVTIFFASPMYAFLMLVDPNYVPPHTIFYYYQIPLLPFVVVGSIRGLRWVLERRRNWLSPPESDARVGGPEGSVVAGPGSGSLAAVGLYVLVLAVGATVMLSKTPVSLMFYEPSQPLMYWRSTYVIPERARVVREIQELIPRDCVVGVSEYLVLHFTHWKHCYIKYPPHAEPVDYIVSDLHDKWRRIYSPESAPFHEEFLAQGDYESIFDKEGFVVLRRRRND